MRTDSIRHLELDERLGLLERISRLTFPASSGRTIYVEHRPTDKDNDRCGIFENQQICYSRSGEWRYHSQPSSSDDTFYRETRYTLAEALGIAKELEKSDKYQ